MQASLDFTLAAATKVLELMREEDNPELKLRVYVTGGGCSGFQYGFAFEDTLNGEDTIVTRDVSLAGETQTVFLLVDPISFQYLAGAQIDYREDVEGAQFIIRNPNASTTCGCGSSFSVD